ncbi:class I SAM-dependent DNA methyltransferase [Cryobacterium sp. PH31-AA6]|uniref:class I SAM-dependent DNA methyltransferase n=1 Tax=Cryobacterium sp. PH31-AA6 TaxID=3046205 RepID=UPI0024B9267A|nr:DNA methyltransferase [Cryobacterium sp. PH31-AA6]MDJ0324323.1 class I SAM-dependent DNA methyltransferase [Cryobacterium sp. PH31-AA6]
MTSGDVKTGVDLSRQKARIFADKWATVTNEKQFAQSFWSDFFHQVIGVEDLLATGVDFEFPIKNVATGTTNFIDVLWGGVVLIEHKSAGKSLDGAEVQARQYMVSLSPHLRPPVLIVSDFANIRIIDVLLGTSVQFPLTGLPKHLDHLDSIFKVYGSKATAQEIDADIKAVNLMANLYVEFEKNGYEGHAASVFMVRILFLNFGDDTRMWKKGLFADFLAESAESGAGLGGSIQELFQILNTHKEERPQNLPASISAFPYVNGGLFKEVIPVFSFNAEMRTALIASSSYDWSKISPAIFGAMFQTIKSKENRRALGEHYTSQQNILKVIRPLFLDEYLEQLRKVWDDRAGLKKLRKDLGTKNYLDPAAGSGNFLLVAYKRLRDIEHKIIARLIELEGKVTTGHDGEELQVGLDGLGTIGLTVSLEQFHAIEFEQWSSQIASVAMYLAEHQANQELDELTGAAPTIFPLSHAATIRQGNALRIDWADVCPMNNDTIIMGNPPFYGSSWLSADQKDDQALVWGKTKSAGILDYVASWYLVAARQMEGTTARAAFVSTSSISQGQQPPVIWGALKQLGMGIDFAHRTFAWNNDGGKNAAVHCVIICFSANGKPSLRSLWSYPSLKAEPVLVRVKNINSYLLDATDALITSRSNPLQGGTQKMTNGNKPVDGGLLSNISVEEAQEIEATDPIAAKYLRRVVGSAELIGGSLRYGLWLKDADPSDLLASPVLKDRIAKVREMRLASTKLDTQKSATRAWEWQQALRQPTTEYLAVPRVSSQEREYVPMAVMPANVVPNDKLLYIPNATSETFGIMMSSVFNIWNRAISGRLKSDYSLSAEVTYNNFPFPDLSNEATMKKVQSAADAVLVAREQFPTSSLAVLYNRNAMPLALRNAHNALDKAVLNAYGLKANATDAGVLELLFGMYADLTQGLLAPEKKTKRRGASPTEDLNSYVLNH